MSYFDAMLFGYFDHSIEIQEKLNESKGLTIHKNLCIKEYEKAYDPDCRLFSLSRIYNLEELKVKSGSQDLTDASIFLKLYRKFGLKGFRLINGKFTIIILEAGKTTIVRDRNGEGHMVFYSKDFFTDSYSGLKRFIDFRPVPDMTGVLTFLKIGYIPAPITSLNGIGKVPAGEALISTKEGISFEKIFDYVEIINQKREPIDLKDAIARYDDLLKKSLKRRIAGDDTPGALLSGGYDSGGNIALMREVHSGTIKTYSIGFKDNPASELPYAKMMADQFGAKHHEYLMDGSEIEYLPEIIDLMGDPFSESGFMLNHSAMKMVSNENLPVVIGGDGNDQYFGAGIRETALHYKLIKSGLSGFSNVFDSLSDNSIFDNDNLAFRLHFQNQKILKVMEPENFGLYNFQLNKLFDLKHIPEHPIWAETPKKFNSYEELFLQRNFYLHLRQTVNEVIIHKASRMSDYFKVHLSFSYTDLDIYNFLQQLPISLRAKGDVTEAAKGKGVTKYIHKQLVKPKLPDAVTNRPKQGGFSPLEIFFNDESRRKKIYRYIQESSFAKSMKDSSYLDVFFNKYENLVTGKSYWFWFRQVKSNQLINLLIIALWWDKVIENKSSNKLSDYLK